MRFLEDLRMGLRGLFSRPLETALLIIGIALGIGATAAGLSLLWKTKEVGAELLSSPEYREIVVRAGSSTSNSDSPAVLVTDTEIPRFSSDDLKAAEEIPSVSAAYLANNTRFRLGDTGPAIRFDGGRRSNSDRQELTITSGPGQEDRETSSESTESVSIGIIGGANGPTSIFMTSDEENEAPNAPPSQDGFDINDVPEEFRRDIEEMMAPAPEVDGPQPILEEMNGKMVSPEYFDAMELTAAEGSIFTQEEAEKNSSIVVLGSTLAKQLFEDGISYGRKIVMDRRIYTITAVLDPTGTDLDEYAFTPRYVSGMMARFMSPEIHFMVADAKDIEDAEFQIEQWFEMNHGNITVTTPRTQVEEANARNARLAIIILLLAGSGFLIATVNVSNILLSRTIRQFRDIGILKALGASAMDIFRLYFIESLFLSIAGMLAGSGVSAIMSKLLSNELGEGSMSLLGALIGIAGAVLVTILLTIYPSAQASKVPAAQAIKTE